MKYYDDIKRVLGVIEENLHNDFRLSDVLVSSHYHESRLNKIFRYYTGYTISTYHRKRLLSESVKMMIKSSKKVGQTAREYGYTTEAYSKAVHDEFGHSPYYILKSRIPVKYTSVISDYELRIKDFAIEDKSFNYYLKNKSKVAHYIDYLLKNNVINEITYDYKTHEWNITLSDEYINSANILVYDCLFRLLEGNNLKKSELDCLRISYSLMKRIGSVVEMTEVMCLLINRLVRENQITR